MPSVLRDRGVVAPGYKADINVIDYDRLQLRPPEVVYDLPSGGRRLIQRTDGYVATIVSGVPVYRDGEATGALAGPAGARRASGAGIACRSAANRCAGWRTRAS